MNAITTVRPEPRTSLEPRTLEEAMRFAGMLAKSSMVPKDFQNRPENVLVAIQWGRELGLGPLQALQNIAVINGRPSVWGDAMLGLVRGSGMCASARETVEGDGDAMVAHCRVIRRDDPNEVVGSFSVADAKKAGLWGKAGPWQQYPKRMLQLRARGFALRDGFPDVLRGVISAEEASDIPATPQDRFVGTTIDAPAPEAPPVPPPPPAAPRQSVTEWLDALGRDLEAALTEAEVQAIGDREQVIKAQTALKNGALKRFNQMMSAAIERTAGITSDGEVTGADGDLGQ
jgi:hypothetical protein